MRCREHMAPPASPVPPRWRGTGSCRAVDGAYKSRNAKVRSFFSANVKAKLATRPETVPRGIYSTLGAWCARRCACFGRSLFLVCPRRSRQSEHRGDTVQGKVAAVADEVGLRWHLRQVTPEAVKARSTGCCGLPASHELEVLVQPEAKRSI